MNAKRKVLLGFATILGALLALAFVNPGDFLREGLRDNFLSDLSIGLLTLLVFDLATEAIDDTRDTRERRSYRAAALLTLDGALHAMWALLVPALERRDPMRRLPSDERIPRFTHDLATDAIWNNAPGAHGPAVRARLRDLGEDADRLLDAAAGIAVDERALAHLRAIRDAARRLDDTWETTPRADLPHRFAHDLAPEIHALLDNLRENP